MNNVKELKVCLICNKPLKFGERGGCFHENGLQHHIECTLTPETEEAILTLIQAENKRYAKSILPKKKDESIRLEPSASSEYGYNQAIKEMQRRIK